MANFVYNISLGRAAEFYYRVDNNDGANSALIVLAVLSSGVEADSVLKDKDTISAVFTASTTEATNVNYARKVLTDTDLAAFAPDDTNDRVDLDIPDQTWSSVAPSPGAWSDVIIAYDPDTTSGTDADIIPISQHDFSVTPDSNDITLQIGANGFFRAS